MLEAAWVDVAVQLGANTLEQVEVEQRSDPGRIVVGAFQYLTVLDQIHTDQQATAGRQRPMQVTKKGLGFFRIKITDAGAGEERQWPFAQRLGGQLQWLAEIGAQRVYVEPAIVGSQPACADIQELTGDIDAQVARRAQGFEQQADLAAGAAAQLHQADVAPGQLGDILGRQAQDGFLGASWIVLRLLADQLEQLGTAVIVEELRRHRLWAGRETTKGFLA